MMLTFTTFFMLYLAMLTPFVSGLMSLGGLLMAVSLSMTVLTGYLAGSWYAFVLFIVYITGLLVLFSYMMSMSPNSYYVKKSNSMSNMFLVSLLFLFLSLFSYSTIIPPLHSGSFEHDVVQIFMPLSMNMFWIMGVILLVALLMAVTICHKSAKPMRSFMG